MDSHFRVGHFSGQTVLPQQTMNVTMESQMLYNKNMQNILNSYLKLKIIGNVCSDFNKLVIHDWRKKTWKIQNISY